MIVKSIYFFGTENADKLPSYSKFEFQKFSKLYEDLDKKVENPSI